MQKLLKFKITYLLIKKIYNKSLSNYILNNIKR